MLIDSNPKSVLQFQCIVMSLRYRHLRLCLLLVTSEQTECNYEMCLPANKMQFIPNYLEHTVVAYY